jgi:hypothetical protein
LILINSYGTGLLCEAFLSAAGHGHALSIFRK